MSASPIPPRETWPRHLFRRADGRFYARVRVPPSLRHSSTHLQRSLKTSNYPQALRRLSIVGGALIVEIRQMVEAKHAAGQATPSLSAEAEAAWFRDEARRKGHKLGFGDHEEDLEAALEHAIDRRLGPVVGERGGDYDREPVHQGEDDARRFADLAYGRVLPVECELEEFVKEMDLKFKYEGRCRRALSRLKAWLVENHGSDNAHGVGRPEAAQFISSLVASGLTTPTVNSLTSSLRVYWKWLLDRGSVKDNPWVSQSRKRRGSEPLGKKRGYYDHEVVKLFTGKTYLTLHDLMRVAALSGMRIDEVAKLTVSDTADDVFEIRVGKTANSERRVPIHRDLKELVKRRVANKRPDERLFDELSGTGKRELSARASIRYTEYRRGLGIDERAPGQRQSNVDFHSWRRWFITKAEQAGQQPHFISAIVGHAEGREGMTLGTYSDGPAMRQMRRVVNSVRLPEGAPIASPDGPIMGEGNRR